MAKQNFIAGGYYGKLGATVGQRWKNIRTLRSYVVPVNPRTPDQMANRNRFAQAIKLAQLSLTFNKGAPVWESANRTEFQSRTSEAKKRIDSGVSGWLALPLYPAGSVPSVTAADLVLSEPPAGGWLVSSATLAAMPATRRFMICARVFDNIEGKFADIMAEVVLGSGNGSVFSLPAGSPLSFVDGSLLVGITNDDSDHENSFCYIAPQTFSPPAEVTISDAGLYFVNGKTLALRSATMSALLGTYTLDVSVKLLNPVSGAYQTETQRVTTVQGAENLALIPLAGTGTFGSVSEASITMVSASGTSTTLLFENVQCVTDANTPPETITVSDIVFNWSADGTPFFSSPTLAAVPGSYSLSVQLAYTVESTGENLTDTKTGTAGNGTNGFSLARQSAATVFRAGVAPVVTVLAQTDYPSKLIISAPSAVNNRVNITTVAQLEAVFDNPDGYQAVYCYSFGYDGSVVMFIPCPASTLPAGSVATWSGTLHLNDGTTHSVTGAGDWTDSELWQGTFTLSDEVALVFPPNPAAKPVAGSSVLLTLQYQTTRLNVNIAEQVPIEDYAD